MAVEEEEVSEVRKRALRRRENYLGGFAELDKGDALRLITAPISHHLHISKAEVQVKDNHRPQWTPYHSSLSLSLPLSPHKLMRILHVPAHFEQLMQLFFAECMVSIVDKHTRVWRIIVEVGCTSSCATDTASCRLGRDDRAIEADIDRWGGGGGGHCRGHRRNLLSYIRIVGERLRTTAVFHPLLMPIGKTIGTRWSEQKTEINKTKLRCSCPATSAPQRRVCAQRNKF